MSKFKPTWQTEDGRIQLYHGNCLTILNELKKVDVVITDPPYGVSMGKKLNNNRKRKMYQGIEDTKENLALLITNVMPKLEALTSRIILTPGVRNMRLWPEPKHTGCLYHPAATGTNPWGFSCWQPIFYYGKDPYGGTGSLPDSIVCTEATSKKLKHPCAKPIKTWTWLVRRTTKDNELVLDPFMGSGTTAISCIRTNRRFIGIELTKDYFDETVRRVKSVLTEPTPFIASL